MAGLQFDCIVLDQAIKYVVIVCHETTESNLTSWRPSLLWYFPVRRVLPGLPVCVAYLKEFAFYDVDREPAEGAIVTDWEEDLWKFARIDEPLEICIQILK